MNGTAGGRRTVAGVDGCPGGWIAVVAPDGCLAKAAVLAASGFAGLLELIGPACVVAVDMPIGLPERIEGRGRPCDVLARALLGPRQSSVFGIPSRNALMAGDYRAACAASLDTSDPPRKVSRQAFNLFGKIREVDAVLRAGKPQARIVEVHPELAFRALRGGTPASLPKKVKSRPHAPGLAERRACLADAGFRPELLDPPGRLPLRAGADDLLDAAACAWSAARIRDGMADCLPADPLRDAFGIEMAIRA